MPKVMSRRFILTLLFALVGCCTIEAQELNAKVMINRQQVSNTKSGVFEALEKAITRFLNERTWTQLPFRENERIQCTFSLTINTYSETDNSFRASMLVASTRPVWGSNYSTTVWNTNDKDCDFTFQEFDQLEWHPEQIDNNLTALLAYWAYFLIGLDMDSMAPLGGTEVLHMAGRHLTTAVTAMPLSMTTSTAPWRNSASCSTPTTAAALTISPRTPSRPAPPSPRPWLCSSKPRRTSR